MCLLSKSYPLTRTTLYTHQTHRAWITIATTLLVFIAALLPRIIGLNDFFTIDEPYHWMQRVYDFRVAVLAGNWAGTDLVGHPGVTTMWLGAIGDWFAAQRGVATRDPQAYTIDYLALQRLPVTLANSICVPVGYVLLRRLLRPSTALLAAIFWATSPFLIGFSRVLHLDAIQASFTTLSVLLLLLALQPEPTHQGTIATPAITRASLAWVLASGICAGLALLTKSSTVIIMPWAMTMFLMYLWRPALSMMQRKSVRAASVYLCLPLVWLAVIGLVFFALWPAMWVHPIHSVQGVINEVIQNGDEPHASGNYFMGQPTEAPGWEFYAAVVVWRSSPLTLIGLALLPLVLLRNREERYVVLWLLVLALWFGLIMSIPPKKFDRYLLPVWPALEIIAAIGVAALLRDGAAQLQQRWQRFTWEPARVGAWGTLLVMVALLLQDALYQPYYLAYYNSLLGGGAPGKEVLLTGWGEGFDQVGAWLRTRPDINKGRVLAEQTLVLKPFLPQVSVEELQRKTLAARNPVSNYAVLYVRGVSRDHSQQLEATIRETVPLHTVVINNITYAEIYQLPRPYDTALNIIFGDGIRLRGFSSTFKRNMLTVSPSWGIERDQPGGLINFVHVVDAQDRIVAQIDAPIDSGAFGDWQAGQQFGDTYTLKLPANLPSGTYYVMLGVYRPATGERLTFTGVSPLPSKVNAPDVLMLKTIKVK